MSRKTTLVQEDYKGFTMTHKARAAVVKVLLLEVNMRPKKLKLSKETLRTLDERELSLVAGGAANSGQFNPAKCPSSGHPNCK
jgi:ribosomal protein L28